MEVISVINLLALFLLLIGTFLGAYGALYFKKGSQVKLKNLFSDLNIITGISYYGISGVFYLSALNLEKLSVVYPFVSLTYVWTVILSIRYLQEKMNRFKYSGLALILIGIIIIGGA